MEGWQTIIVGIIGAIVTLIGIYFQGRKDSTRIKDIDDKSSLIKPNTETIIQQLQNQQTENKSQFDRAEATTKSQFDKVGSQFDKVGSQFDKVGSQFDKVGSQFDKVDSQFDKVDSQFDKVGNQIRRLQESEIRDISNFVTEERTLRTNSKNQHFDFMHIADGIKSLGNEVTQLKESLDCRYTQIETLELELDKAKSLIVDLQKEVSFVKEENKTLINKVENSHFKTEELAAENQELQNQLEDLESINKELEEELNGLSHDDYVISR